MEKRAAFHMFFRLFLYVEAYNADMLTYKIKLLLAVIYS